MGYYRSSSAAITSDVLSHWCACKASLQTHTIAQLLLIMLKQQQQQRTSRMSPILVCAETHTATDNTALKLLVAAQQLDPADGLRISKQDILRVGDMARVSQELKRYHISNLAVAASV